LEEVLAEVVRGILRQVDAIAAGGFDLVPRWETHCLLRGRTVTIDQTPGLVTGRCVGIGADGSLRLQTLAGEQRIYAGVVRGWE
jgi:biotin-(acetyl-CoA carboxylase) ligase